MYQMYQSQQHHVLEHASQPDNPPEFDETLMDKDSHKVARQIVPFAGQQDYAVKRFRPKLEVQLQRGDGGRLQMIILGRWD